MTEEIVPGFKFSRASYLAGLLRPTIIKDLELEKFGFKYLSRNPSSFTPTTANSYYRGKYLLLGEDEEANKSSIAQFSAKDAEAFVNYELFLGQVREILQPLLDNAPVNVYEGKWREKVRTLQTLYEVTKRAVKHRHILPQFYELFTGNAAQILNRWFESDILKTTLATDAVIGALISPKDTGSSYVLLHHVMGEAAGKKGVWAYVEGGMGSVSDSIARSALHKGAEILTNVNVEQIIYQQSAGNNVKAIGVKLRTGEEIYADTILSAASVYHTFMELSPGLSDMDIKIDEFLKHIKHTDHSCGAFKINLAVNKLPNFTCYPSPEG